MTQCRPEVPKSLNKSKLGYGQESSNNQSQSSRLLILDVRWGKGSLIIDTAQLNDLSGIDLVEVQAVSYSPQKETDP